MKRFGITAVGASVLLGMLSMTASAEDIMTFRMAADETAFTTEKTAKEDQVIHGGLYIDNYTALNCFRVILKSDAPLVIENGDFTRLKGETDQYGDPHLAFFKEYDEAVYTPKSVIDDDTNIAVWRGVSDFPRKNGEVYHADSSILSFDIRIPKDTPPGDYQCYISTEVKTVAGDMKNPDFYATSAEKDLKIGEDILLEPLTIEVYQRGDVNCNGEVGVEDAQFALNYYVSVILSGSKLSDDEQAALLGTKSIRSAVRAAEVSGDKLIQVEDAQGILMYATEALTGNEPNWDKIFSSSAT